MSALRATPDAHTMLGYSETVRSVRRWILDSCMCIIFFNMYVLLYHYMVAPMLATYYMS